MDQIEKIVLAVFGGIITIAIIATFVGKNSQAPQVIAATGNFISDIVGAAVNPIHTASTNGNLGANTFTNPLRN